MIVNAGTARQSVTAPTLPVGAAHRLRPRLVRPSLQAVGILVDSLYPSGATKLERRCLDAVAGKAIGHVVTMPGEPVVGFAMETPKGNRTVKLSTIWIAPNARRRGIGSSLVSKLILGWHQRGVDRAYVTARVGIHDEILASFSALGFKLAAIEKDRYGIERHEAVVEWTSDRSPDELWLQYRSSLLSSIDI
jgi:ribosomal protein S18 acetylase RimI-like enzyme